MNESTDSIKSHQSCIEDMKLAYDKFVTLVREGKLEFDHKRLSPRTTSPTAQINSGEGVDEQSEKQKKYSKLEKFEKENSMSKADTDSEAAAEDATSSQNTTILSFTQDQTGDVSDSAADVSDHNESCWSQSTIVSHKDENNLSLNTTLQDNASLNTTLQEESFSQRSAAASQNGSLSQMSDASDSSRRVSLREVRRRLRDKMTSSPTNGVLVRAERQEEEKPVKRKRGRPPKSQTKTADNVDDKEKQVIDCDKQSTDVTASPKRKLRTRKTLRSAAEESKTESQTDKQSDCGDGTKDNPLTLFSDEECAIKIQPGTYFINFDFETNCVPSQSIKIFE